MYLSLCRCDSFGNRPVNATNNHYRKNSFGSGRVRSGSTGNRPVKVNNSYRPVRYSAANDTPITRAPPPRAPVVIREPPHQQPSQQHNFAAPRKGIFNSTTLSNVQNNRDSNARSPLNNRDHNKENVTSGQAKNDANEAKLGTSAGAGTSVTSGSPVTSAVAANK